MIRAVSMGSVQSETVPLGLCFDTMLRAQINWTLDCCSENGKR